MDFSLTIGKHLWCYRAHCMQAKIVNDTAFHGATLATDALLEGSVVLVSLPLPLLLIGSSRCGMSA